MNNLTLGLLVVLFLVSCASSSKPPVDFTEANLSRGLADDLTRAQKCETSFDESAYAHFVAKNKKEKNIDLKAYFKALEQRPSACAMAQVIPSLKITMTAATNIRNNKTKSRLGLKDLKALRHSVLNTDLVLGEFLVSLVLVDAVSNSNFLDKESSQVLAKMKKELFNQQDALIERTIKHDILVVQSTLKTTSLSDWAAGLGEPELDKNIKYNKYEEILKTEQLKTTILENQKCISEKSCFLCYTNIQTNSCVEEKLTQIEQVKKYDNSLSLMILTPKYKDGIVKLKNKLSEYR